MARDEGRIGPRTRWKEYEPTILDEPAYAAVKGNTSGSRPRELFEDLVGDLEEAYEKAKARAGARGVWGSGRRSGPPIMS